MMLCERVERRLPYSAEQLFDLAADVERYPEFLPGWSAAHIRQRQEHVYYTDQTLELGPFRIRFESKTVLHRPQRIYVIADTPPFRRFRLSWIFKPQPRSSCKVDLVAEMEFRSHLLERFAERLLTDMINDIAAAFEARARRLYETGETTSQLASRD